MSARIVNRLHMLDTNTVSYIVRGKSPAARASLARISPNRTVCISAITEAELRYGLAKIPHSQVLHSALETFLSKLEVLAWGREAASAYGHLRAAQEAAGKTLGNLDMLIAAHAISAGAVLVTNDKAFKHVPSLRPTVNWATDL